MKYICFFIEIVFFDIRLKNVGQNLYSAKKGKKTHVFAKKHVKIYFRLSIVCYFFKCLSYW